jgi:hypothetical protein
MKPVQGILRINIAKSWHFFDSLESIEISVIRLYPLSRS